MEIVSLDSSIFAEDICAIEFTKSHSQRSDFALCGCLAHTVDVGAAFWSRSVEGKSVGNCYLNCSEVTRGIQHVVLSSGT